MTEHNACAFSGPWVWPPGRKGRELEGKERDQVLLMLAMLGKPAVAGNNKYSYSEEYVHAGRHWCVTTWHDGRYTVEEIERETDT